MEFQTFDLGCVAGWTCRLTKRGECLSPPPCSLWSGAVSQTLNLHLKPGCLCRANLKINVRESAEMDQADLELRATIMKVISLFAASNNFIFHFCHEMALQVCFMFTDWLESKKFSTWRCGRLQEQERLSCLCLQKTVSFIILIIFIIMIMIFIIMIISSS